jgi:hypothetical protein
MHLYCLAICQCHISCGFLCFELLYDTERIESHLIKRSDSLCANHLGLLVVLIKGVHYHLLVFGRSGTVLALEAIIGNR